MKGSTAGWLGLRGHTAPLISTGEGPVLSAQVEKGAGERHRKQVHRKLGISTGHTQIKGMEKYVGTAGQVNPGIQAKLYNPGDALFPQ